MEQKYFLSVSLNQGFFRDQSLSNGLPCVLAQVTCLACQRAKHAIRDIRKVPCLTDYVFSNYSQTCDSYNIRILFAIDRCLLSKSKFIFILLAFSLNSEMTFNIRSIFLCATTVLTETPKTFSRSEFYLSPCKINEDIMKVNGKIVAKKWWNLCKNTS